MTSRKVLATQRDLGGWGWGKTEKGRQSWLRSASIPEMQFNLNGALGGAAALGGLKDTVEHIGHARAGLLPSIAGVKCHHRMGNQVNGLGLVGKTLIEQLTFLKVKSEREESK